MLRTRISSAFLLFVLYVNAYSQESNLERYTPSALFEKGAWEINVFNNIYTQQQVRNSEGSDIDLGQRQTFYNGLYQFTYGISNNRRINIGADVLINRSFYDIANGSPFKIFSGSESDFSRTIVSAAGPRVKVVPFEDLQSFSIQSSFYFPIADDQESPAFTAHDRYTSFTQFFYDHKINSSWRIFLEIDALYRIKRNDNQVNFLRLPASAFISYFPSSKTTIYFFGQYSPRFEKQSNAVDEVYGLSSWFTQVGIGMKYQVTNKLGLEVSYGDFILSRNDGAGSTINLGIRYIH